MSKVAILTLEELADVASVIGQTIGGTVGVVARVTGLVLTTASETVRIVDAKEIERIRKERALYTAAGKAAHEAAKNAGPKR